MGTTEKRIPSPQGGDRDRCPGEVLGRFSLQVHLGHMPVPLGQLGCSVSCDRAVCLCRARTVSCSETLPPHPPHSGSCGQEHLAEAPRPAVLRAALSAHRYTSDHPTISCLRMGLCMLSFQKVGNVKIAQEI